MQAELGRYNTAGRCRIGAWGGRGGCGARACGGCGRASGAPGVDLVQPALARASKIKRKKVSSTPEVSDTQQKRGPDASDFSSASDLGTCLHRSRVPDF